LPPETDVARPTVAPPPPGWPRYGEVEFDGVRARYAPGLPEVLKGVSFRIEAGAKVGIAGRTGAGKSSLIQVLYRFIELDAGEIRIDGVDIATVPKATLRRALAIIPQSPTLFLGTLRENLDRFEAYSDGAIWRALEQVQLAALVRTLADGLRTAVLENGANFSEGQKQLLCLARALLSDAKVVILDEATANVDVVTDQMIHQAIQTAFADRTMIIIAHRLGTISHCDLVIELESGRVRWQRPRRLLTLEDESDGTGLDLALSAKVKQPALLVSPSGGLSHAATRKGDHR
jgi:ABC-type multidrug transport system fused ATPase/permease subunit